MRAQAILGAATDRLRLGAANWAERRQGPDPVDLVLKRRRIYILPSRFGIIFGLLVLAMVLGAMNYASSLGFGLAFLLTGLGLVTMHHCHNNLMGAQIRFVGAKPVFAGQKCRFRLSLTNHARAPRYELTLSSGGFSSVPQDLAPGETRAVGVEVPAERRGRLRLGRISIATRFPGNLFRAWSWIHMRGECIVYPRPATPGRPLPFAGPIGGSQGTGKHGDADFAGLRETVEGDPPQHIAWKAFELDVEARLSQLARWCLDAFEQGCAFGLTLPGRKIPLGAGRDQLHECLKALALYDGAAS
jgi:uncharacterized protein (DUF58 family)